MRFVIQPDRYFNRWKVDNPQEEVDEQTWINERLLTSSERVRERKSERRLVSIGWNAEEKNRLDRYQSYWRSHFSLSLSSSVTRSCLDKFTTPPPSCHDRVNLRIQPRNHHVSLPFSSLSLNAKSLSLFRLDSYIALTAMAIQQSQEKMLPLNDIYKVSVSTTQEPLSTTQPISFSLSPIDFLTIGRTLRNGRILCVTISRSTIVSSRFRVGRIDPAKAICGLCIARKWSESALLCLMIEIPEAHSMCFFHQ